ncbi:MAG: carboxypeptidase-like regulatory domain-containing protein [Armatimonadota bacterium]
MRLKRTVFLCALVISTAILATMLAGCGGGDDDPTVATLYGKIIHNGTHEPMRGVQVVAGGNETRTVADGTWALVLDNRGGTTVHVLFEGYESVELQAPAGEGKIYLGTTSLVPQVLDGNGIIKGIVADAGRPVEGAHVSVGEIHGVTDAEGKYILYNVPQGSRDVTATTGDKWGTKNVLVVSQRTVTADIAVSDNPPIIPF